MSAWTTATSRCRSRRRTQAARPCTRCGATWRARLAAAGFCGVEVRTELSPPWSSDLISAEGRRKLAAAGIAPPRSRPEKSAGPVPLTLVRARPGGRVPGLRIGGHRADGRVQRDRVQGPVPVPCVRRAVRARQGDLSDRDRRGARRGASGASSMSWRSRASTGCATTPSPSPSLCRPRPG